MDSMSLKSISCDGLTVAPGRGEEFTLYPWNRSGYKGLIVATVRLKSHWRKPDGRWATDHIRDLSLISSTLADIYGCALIMVKSDEEANRVVESYIKGAPGIGTLIKYFQGVVD